jgi:hypothetical protein
MSTPATPRVLQIAFVALETLFVGSFVCVFILAYDSYRNGLTHGGVLSVVLLASALPLGFVSFLIRHTCRTLAVIGGCTILAVILYVLFTPRLWIDAA